MTKTIKLTNKERRVLMDAIDVLKWDGWRQGAFGEVGGPVCGGGAIAEVLSGGRETKVYNLVEDAYGTARRIGDAVSLAAGLNKNKLSYLNDRHNQTKEKMIWYMAIAAGIDPTLTLIEDEDEDDDND